MLILYFFCRMSQGGQGMHCHVCKKISKIAFCYYDRQREHAIRRQRIREYVHFTQVIPACYTVCGAEDSELKGGFKLNIIIGIIVGGIAGWLAGQIMGSRFSVLGNVIIGVVGGFVGSTVLRLVGIYSYGMIGNIIVAVIGACICIAVMRMLK